MQDKRVKTSRSIGWILFLGGLLVAAGAGLYAFILKTDMALSGAWVAFAMDETHAGINPAIESSQSL